MITYDPQKHFNDIWNHFIVNKNKPSAINGKCFYRHPDNNRKCAIGVLIPDELYNPEWDEYDFSGSLNDVMDSVIYDYDIDFMLSLQYAHDLSVKKDNSDFLNLFKERMIDIADDFNLKVPQ